MKSKKLIFFGVILCLLSTYYGKSNSPPPEYDVLAHRIRSQTAKQLKKEKDLIPGGTMGQMMDDVKAVGLTFQYFHTLNLEEARKLLVYAIQVFLRNYNENKEVRPFLHNYPFTSKNIEIDIFIYQPDGDKPKQGDLAVLSLENGILTYELTAPKKYAPWPVLHKETFEEALKIVNDGS